MLASVMRSCIDSAPIALARVLDRLVVPAVHAEPAAQEQHHVLGGDAVAEPAAPLDQDGMRHLAARSRR